MTGRTGGGVVLVAADSVLDLVDNAGHLELLCRVEMFLSKQEKGLNRSIACPWLRGFKRRELERP